MSESKPESNNSNNDKLRNMRVAALKYNSQEDRAPVVVAAGAGHVAQKIIEVADQCGITIYHDDTAATLLSRLELGQAIPPELYQLVVDIYISVMAAAGQAKPSLLPNDKPGEDAQK